MNQLTDYMQISELCFGRHRIYLAHVTSMVLLFHIIDVQKPRAMLVVFVVCHTDARIPRDHMIVHGQYGWLLEMYPRHLRIARTKRNDRSVQCSVVHTIRRCVGCQPSSSYVHFSAVRHVIVFPLGAWLLIFYRLPCPDTCFGILFSRKNLFVHFKWCDVYDESVECRTTAQCSTEPHRAGMTCCTCGSCVVLPISRSK